MLKNNKYYKYLKYKQKYINLIGGAPGDSIYHDVPDENYHIYNDNGVDKYNSCAICFDEYKTNQIIKLLECNHYFHEKCVYKLLTCPLCRKNISENSKNLFYHKLPKSKLFELNSVKINKINFNSTDEKNKILDELSSMMVHLGNEYDKIISTLSINALKLIKLLREFKDNVENHLIHYNFSADEIIILETYIQTCKELIQKLIDSFN